MAGRALHARRCARAARRCCRSTASTTRSSSACRRLRAAIRAARGVRRILLTASGGPFRTRAARATSPRVTPDEACAHPNWVMGRKISVDSATMMNKGLEVIEAHWLFGVPRERDRGGDPSAERHPFAGRIRRRLGARAARQSRHAHADRPRARAFPSASSRGVAPLDLARARRARVRGARPARAFPASARLRGAARRRHRARGAQRRQRSRGRRVPRRRARASPHRRACVEQALARMPARAASRSLERRCCDADARSARRVAARGRCACADRAWRSPHDRSSLIDSSSRSSSRSACWSWSTSSATICVRALCGVKVLRFSVGFGRVALVARARARPAPSGRSSAIPLGGYVKMLDEREGDGRRRRTCRAPSTARACGKRIAIVLRARSPTSCSRSAVRGLFMPACRAEARARRDRRADTPAAAAGVRDGDIVVAVDGEPVRTWQDLRWRLLQARSGTRGASTRGRAARRRDARMRRLDARGAHERRLGTQFPGAAGPARRLGTPLDRRR